MGFSLLFWKNVHSITGYVGKTWKSGCSSYWKLVRIIDITFMGGIHIEEL